MRTSFHQKSGQDSGESSPCESSSPIDDGQLNGLYSFTYEFPAISKPHFLERFVRLCLVSTDSTGLLQLWSSVLSPPIPARSPGGISLASRTQTSRCAHACLTTSNTNSSASYLQKPKQLPGSIQSHSQSESPRPYKDERHPAVLTRPVHSQDDINA